MLIQYMCVVGMKYIMYNVILLLLLYVLLLLTTTNNTTSNNTLHGYYIDGLPNTKYVSSCMIVS
jgi:hypothetical protein